MTVLRWVVTVVTVYSACGGGGSDDARGVGRTPESAAADREVERSTETRPPRGDLPYNRAGDLGNVVTGGGVELRTVTVASVRVNDVYSYLDLVVEARVVDGHGPTRAMDVSLVCADDEQSVSYKTDDFDNGNDLPLLGIDEAPITDEPSRWRVPGYFIPSPLPEGCRDGRTWVLVEVTVSEEGVASSDLGDGRIEQDTGAFLLPVAVDFDQLATDAAPWPQDRPKLSPVCDAIAGSRAVTEAAAESAPLEPCTFRRGGEQYVDVDLSTDPEVLAAAGRVRLMYRLRR